LPGTEKKLSCTKRNWRKIFCDGSNTHPPRRERKGRIALRQDDGRARTPGPEKKSRPLNTTTEKILRAGSVQPQAQRVIRLRGLSERGKRPRGKPSGKRTSRCDADRWFTRLHETNVKKPRMLARAREAPQAKKKKLPQTSCQKRRTQPSRRGEDRKGRYAVPYTDLSIQKTLRSEMSEEEKKRCEADQTRAGKLGRR